MRIYIIRHGETETNTKGMLQGRTDGRLNENGRALAVVTGRSMKGIHFDACITSPLARAKETVEIILRETANEIPIAFDDRLQEISFGDQENATLPELGDDGVRFMTDPFSMAPFPNGESVRDVCKRTQSFLKELIAADDGRTYLVGTHGCALRAMLNFLYDDPSDYWQGRVPYNCAVNIIDAEHGAARLTEKDKIYYDPSLAVDHYRQ